MKKALTLLLAALMLMTLCVSAMAANGGTITVDNAKKDESYDLYHILDLTTDASGDKVLYTVPASGEWDAFYQKAEVLAILNVDTASGVVSWKSGVDETSGTATLAKLALAYVQTNASVTAAASQIADASGTLVFDNLDYGYYLLNTSIGSICALNSNNKAVVISDKHGTPTVVKEVSMDGTAYTPAISAEIGEVIRFQAVLTDIQDVKNLVFADTMATGLTFNPASLKVTCNGTVMTAGEATYQLNANPAAPKTFEVTFADGHHALEADESVVIDYTATVNSSAIIGGTGNINTAKLTYGNKQESAADSATTFVYGFAIQKNDQTGNALANAEFVISRNGGQEFALVANGKLTGWTTEKATAVLISPADGKITVEGLAAGTYAIEETAAPAGYSKLANAITLVIAQDGAVTADGNAEADKIVEIVNSTGTVLPTTGGVGTTVLVTVGVLGVLILGVFLVTNKRMAKETI